MADEDALAATVKQLKSKRAIIKSNLTRFQTFINTKLQTDPAKIKEVNFRLQNAQSLLEEFNSVHSQLMTAEDDEIRVAELESELETFEEAFYEIIAKAHEISTPKTDDNESIAGSADARSYSNHSNIQPGYSLAQGVKLPVIDLPSFNGSPEKWLQFHDTFDTLIDNDPSLSDIQKFYYLKSCLKDKAESVIASLEITKDNYPIAWNLLKERFQNEKLIIHSHIRTLFELPSIQKESYEHLRKLIDEVNRITRILTSLKQPVEHWDSLLIYLISVKLDSNTRRKWESTNLGTSMPTFNAFISFLKNQCVLLETLHSSQTNKVNTTEFQRSDKFNYKQGKRCNSFVSQSSFQTFTRFKCSYCTENHMLYYCPKFLALSVKNRTQEIKNLRLCTNCFKKNHCVENCENTGCKHCGQKHNSLLHPTDIRNANNTQPGSRAFNNSFKNYSHNQNQNRNQGNFSQSHTSNSQSPRAEAQTTTQGHAATLQSQSNTVVLSSLQNDESEVLLATAIIYIVDRFGKSHKARALLDSGSQSHFLTTSLSAKLHLTVKEINLPVTGINQSKSYIKHCARATIKSRVSQYQTSAIFMIIDKITENLPTVKISLRNCTMPDLVLADENFDQPGKIDMLIGADLFYDIMCVGKVKLGERSPIARNTQFGWVITGNAPTFNFNHEPRTQVCNFSASITTTAIQDQLKQFWELEGVETMCTRKLSKEEQECEDEYKKALQRDQTGRYIVPILIKGNIQDLGDSREAALNRFFHLERKFEKNPEFKEQYVNFMREYRDLGHMTKSTDKEDKNPTYYVAHHGVMKQSSSTTKLRAVFDASAKTTTNISLNDRLKKGPILQPDLFTILVRFRCFNIVLAADVEKMYRQVWIRKDERSLQKIFWRENSSEELCTYILNTVTYGTTSASFLAIRTLVQIAEENKSQFPEACRAIKEGFYVDDLLYGTNNVEEAKQLKQELQLILQQAGFILRKWLSNEQSILSVGHESKDIAHFISENHVNKTLGLCWSSRKDTLQFSVSFPTSSHITKRHILSVIARIFDPLGIIGPCVLQAKIFLQKLWKLNSDWDDPIPADLYKAWIEFEEGIRAINDFEIPRRVILPQPEDIQIHAFCDASESGYGGAVYLRSRENGGIQMRLLCAKSRVAPVKNISIPKLELCAAHLLVNLVQVVRGSLNIQLSKTTFWTDSSIVLCWLSEEPYKWKTFVSNRVSDIQQVTHANEWKHISTNDNPADCISKDVVQLSYQTHPYGGMDLPG